MVNNYYIPGYPPAEKVVFDIFSGKTPTEMWTELSELRQNMPQSDVLEDAPWYTWRNDWDRVDGRRTLLQPIRQGTVRWQTRTSRAGLDVEEVVEEAEGVQALDILERFAMKFEEAGWRYAVFANFSLLSIKGYARYIYYPGFVDGQVTREFREDLLTQQAIQLSEREAEKYTLRAQKEPKWIEAAEHFLQLKARLEEALGVPDGIGKMRARQRAEEQGRGFLGDFNLKYPEPRESPLFGRL